MNDTKKLKWKKCNECGFLQYISHLRCLKCKADNFESIVALGTYTILKAPPMEFREQGPYALGVVEFENGVKALGQLTKKENLKTGIKLQPIYKKICNALNDKEVYSFVFKPLE
jgi:uncharacterized OB-fold protein